MLTARTGHTATVFGATGQLGRYIVNRLGEFYGVYDFNCWVVRCNLTW